MRRTRQGARGPCRHRIPGLPRGRIGARRPGAAARCVGSGGGGGSGPPATPEGSMRIAIRAPAGHVPGGGAAPGRHAPPVARAAASSSSTAMQVNRSEGIPSLSALAEMSLAPGTGRPRAMAVRLVPPGARAAPPGPGRRGRRGRPARPRPAVHRFRPPDPPVPVALGRSSSLRDGAMPACAVAACRGFPRGRPRASVGAGGPPPMSPRVHPEPTAAAPAHPAARAC